MTSIVNLFSNFNDLNKEKSVTDGAAEYKASKVYLNTSTPALTQGEKFKNYQRKIKKNLEKKINYVNSKEGFNGLQQIQNGLQLNGNGLTAQTTRIIQKNDLSSNEEQTIDNVRQQYANTLTEYENLLAQINGSTTGYLNRVNPNNRYLGKNIGFTNGKLAFVTQQGVVKLYPNLNVLENTVGKNGCPDTNAVSINLPWLTAYNTPGTQIPSNPPLVTGTPMQIGQSCGNEGVNVFVNTMINNPSATYEGCYADNTSSPLMTNLGNSYNYQQCMDAAVDGGYQYFALQNVNTSTSEGTCMASNNYNTAISLGASMVPNGMVPLWASNTAAGETSSPGSTAMLSVTGALSVLNSSGQSIFNTPTSNANPSNYLGCYGDGPNRAMPLYNGGSQQYNNAQCQQIAQQNGAAFYGLQNSTSGQTAQCAISSNWGQTSEYGIAGNCTQIGDGSYSGGGWSNAV
jgi:hypothetical protein